MRGQADFGKLEVNNIRKDSGNSKRLSVVNVINLKRDQLEINVAECSDLRTFVDGRENYYPWPFQAFYANIQTNKHSIVRAEKVGMPLDQHLKFTGKTSDQPKCSRSALTDAYVDKRVAGKKDSTNTYQYRPTSAGEKSNAPWDGLVDLWRCGRIHCLHLVWLASCKT